MGTSVRHDNLHLVCNAHWLGLRATQIQGLASVIGLCSEEFSTNDERIRRTMLQRIAHLPNSKLYQRELNAMSELGKHEIQWLYGHPEGLAYLSRTFLPDAILHRDYI